MKFITDPILKSADEARAFADRVVERGQSLVTSTLGSLSIFSDRAVVSSEDSLEDETHYFLVPYHLAESRYLLYTSRVLPDGYSPENDLPKRRWFHVPGSGSEVVLERLWLDAHRAAVAKSDSAEVPLHERLNQLGDEIDRKSDLVSGGLLLVGGVLAVSNPLLGVGIAAKAILPSFGARVSSEGLRHLGGKLKRRQTDQASKASEKEASKALREVEASVVVNPLLQALEKALVTTEAEFDPMLDFDEMTFQTLEPDRGILWLRLTAGAITSLYEEVRPRDFPAANLGPEDVRWLETLKAFQDPK